MYYEHMLTIISCHDNKKYYLLTYYVVFMFANVVTTTDTF